MRIVSLLPAATEIAVALGALDDLVAVSHECDYPEAVRTRPRVTMTPIDIHATGAVIDAAVRELTRSGTPVISVDGPTFARLAPDVVITQDLCEVCAVLDGQVHRLASAMTPAPAVLALSGRNLTGIWEDIRAVGEGLGRSKEAEVLTDTLQRRLASLTPKPVQWRPRVLCVEWLDPLYLAGHWVPELVEAAGGEDVGARAGDHSTRRTWREARSLEADLVIIMLCGFDVARSLQELAALTDPDALALIEAGTTWILDGNAYTSRPGPRVVEGAERIRSAILGREMNGLRRWAPGTDHAG
jgi:iron complex transport system substrate-binding protein